MQKVKLIYEDGDSSFIHVPKASHKSDVVPAFVEGINNAKTKLKKGDDVYVMPQSVVTRDDINYLKDEMGISQKRKTGAYNKTILSKKYIEKLITEDYSQRVVKVNRASVINLLEHIIDNYEEVKNKSKSVNRWYRSFPDLSCYKNLLSNIKRSSTVKDTEISIYTEYYNETLDHLSLPKNNLLKEVLTSRGFIYFYLSDKNFNEFQSIWKQRNKVVTEDYVKNFVSADNPITLEAVESIEKMLKGTDEDTELAVITLSKMNYRNHIDMVYYLVSKYDSLIRFTQAYNSAGCKDLKSIIQNMPWNRVDNLMEVLRERNQLSKEGLKLFLTHIISKIDQNYNMLGISIDPDNVKLKKEYDEIRS